MTKGKERQYRGERYWEMETPEERDTGRIRVRFFPEAGKLQISQTFLDGGEVRTGKTVTLDREDLNLHPEARDLIIAAIEGWQ